MILTDASVVIVYERFPTVRLKKIIADAGAVVCGLTVAEHFAGRISRSNSVDETRQPCKRFRAKRTANSGITRL